MSATTVQQEDVLLLDEKDEKRRELFEPSFFSSHQNVILDVILLVFLGALLGIFAVGYVEAVKRVPALWLTPRGDANATWVEDPDAFGFLQGEPYWIVIAVGCGVITGLHKIIFGVDEMATFLDHISNRHVEFSEALHSLVLCLFANFAGASLGPEAGMAGVGAAAGLLLAKLVNRLLPSLSPRSELYAAMGMCSCIAPFLPSPFISMLLVIELGPPLTPPFWNGRSRMHVMVLMFVGVTASFASYYSIVPRPFLNLGEVVLSVREARNLPSYDFAIGLAFGVVGALLALAYAFVGALVKFAFALASRLWECFGTRLRIFANCVLGGLVFGVIGYIAPLTLGSGETFLPSLIVNGPLRLSSGLLVASLFLKMVTAHVCMVSGLIGGNFFPLLFIGALAGQCASIWTGINQQLAISCSFGVLATALVPVPFTIIMMSYMSFVLQPSACFPVFCASFTSYLLFVGVGVPQKLMSFAAQQK